MTPKFIMIAIAGVALVAATYSCAKRSHNIRQAPESRAEASPHYYDGEFKPHKDVLTMSLIDNLKVAWKFLVTDNDRTPNRSLPMVPMDRTMYENVGHNGNRLHATWLGHSSLLIRIDGVTVLTDPVFENKISIVGPTRFGNAMPISLDALPFIDAVIISHDHYDHLNKWTVQQLNPKTDRFIVPLNVGVHLEKWGVPPEKIVSLDWWEDVRIHDAVVVTATPAQHFSGRGLFDRNKTLWASWVMVGPTHRVFYSGDSGYFDGFKAIGDAHGPFDMTFLECGAYDRMWHGVHMLPEETVQAHIDLRGKVLHPIHWGTFNLALHPWHEPMNRITAAAAPHQVTVATPMRGETTRFPDHVPSSRWWEPAKQNDAQAVQHH